jgi:hypothetical protein
VRKNGYFSHYNVFTAETMVTNLIRAQKRERDKKLAIKYIGRERIPAVRKYLDTPLIKVVTGPRRSGKSVFCLELLKNSNFAYLDFDEKELLKISEEKIISGLKAVYPQAKYYLFDEIQNYPDWELFVNKLQRRGYNLVLTGSNAKLLSGELATHLTGRYMDFTVLPFSFREYLLAKQGNIDDYLLTGGFPEIVTLNLNPAEYLQTLSRAILFTDVVKRHSLRFSGQVDELAKYLATNFSGEISFNKLQKALSFRSFHTVKNYVSYLEESFLFFVLNRFDYKFKEQLRAPRKIYLVDNGLVKALSFEFTENLGKLLENAVFLEFIRRGFIPNKTLFYYQTRTGREVDFILRRGYKVESLIQVCHDFSDEKTKVREKAALEQAGKELNCNNFQIITSRSSTDWFSQ